MQGFRKFLRGAAFLTGCLVLAVLVVRMVHPGPDLEMTDERCQARNARPGLAEGLVRVAKEIATGGIDGLQADWAGLCMYRKSNAEVLAGPPVRVVMIGDSITEQWQSANPELFGKSVVNRGIKGQTSAQILVRFRQDAVALRPKIVHIMAGLNDIAGNTGRMRPEDYKNNISAMIDMAQANGITVMIGSITPAKDFFWRKGIDPSRRIVELNRWLAETAKARGLVYADYHRVLADPRGYPRPALDEDGSHPNSAGFDAMKPVLEAALAEAESGLRPTSAAAASAGGGS